jgi:mono/diheme cytochrome c family protein
MILVLTSCKKDSYSTASLYNPAASDVTPTSTLQDLQNGRALYVSNCGQCHNYYLPENFTPLQWANILSSMAPRTSMSATQTLLVKKYVSKGR